MLYDDYIQYTQQYKNLYGERTVVLMEVGSFWELYSCDKGLGANMKDVCNLLNITLSRKNKNILEVSSSNPLMAGFPSHALGKFLPILINDDWTVVLVGQTSPPPNPKRAVTNIFSKGTYFPDSMTENNNFIMCLVIDTSVQPISKALVTCIGIAMVDVSTGQVEIGELCDVDPQLLADDIFRIYSRIQPSELLIYKSSNMADLKCLEKIINTTTNKKIKDYTRYGVDVQICKLEYQSFVLKKVYNAFVGKSMISIHETLDIERDIYACVAITGLMRYVLDHDPTLLRNISLPVRLSLDTPRHMCLYANCAEQLELPALIGKINKCVTPIGKRFFRNRLFNPLVCPLEIQQAIDSTESFLDVFLHTRTVLSEVCDVERMFRKISTNRIHPHELASLVGSLHAVFKLGEDCSVVHQLTSYLENYLDTEVCLQTGNENLCLEIFKNGVHDSLDTLSNKRRHILSKYENAIDTWNSMTSPNAFKLEMNDRDGMFVLVTSKRYDVSKLAGIKCNIFETLTKVGATNTHIKLKNDSMVSDYDLITSLDAEISVVTQNLYRDMLETFVSKFACHFDHIISRIAYYDFHSTAAMLAKQNNYVKPVITINNTCSTVNAKAMRHPLVELLDTGISFVPNDIELDKHRCWLLYGLNAAGKSTLMKMVAVNIILAQSGLYTPCDSMQLTPFTSIFTRITKGDDILSSKSTFMVEISELRNVLKRANKNSLVIGDELCSGTETLSAIAIVHTSINDLLDSGASFIFATHLHELVHHFQQNPKIHICHLHVEYVDDCLVYDRSLRSGDGPKTYGVEVCRYLDMPDHFVKRAIQFRQILEKGRLDSAALTSKYNKSLLHDGVCESCGKQSSAEVHHIKHQASHQKIQSGQMNMLSNLMVLCEECHDKVHAGNINVNKKHMTSHGIQTEVDHIELVNTKTTDTCDLENEILTLSMQDHLSISKVIETIYRNKGISLSKYRVRKTIQNHKKLMQV